jgi:hypothetical protein
MVSAGKVCCRTGSLPAGRQTTSGAAPTGGSLREATCSLTLRKCTNRRSGTRETSTPSTGRHRSRQRALRPALPGPPAPHEFPALGSLSAFGSPISYVRLRCDSVPYICSCGIDWFLIQGSTAPLTTQAGLALGKQASRQVGQVSRFLTGSRPALRLFIPNPIATHPIT